MNSDKEQTLNKFGCLVCGHSNAHDHRLLLGDLDRETYCAEDNCYCHLCHSCKKNRFISEYEKAVCAECR
jgi:hypothetical protein